MGSNHLTHHIKVLNHQQHIMVFFLYFSYIKHCVVFFIFQSHLCTTTRTFNTLKKVGESFRVRQVANACVLNNSPVLKIYLYMIQILLYLYISFSFLVYMYSDFPIEGSSRVLNLLKLLASCFLFF